MNERVEEIRSLVADGIIAAQKFQSDKQIAAFVIGQHDTGPRQCRQALLEIERALDALDEAAICQRKLERKIAEWEKVRNPEGDDEAELLRIAHRRQHRAMIGKMRELETLVAIFQSFPEFSYEQYEAAEAEYWRQRITRQALNGIVHRMTGIPIGDLDSMKALGIPIEEVIEGVRPCLETIRKSLEHSASSGTSLLPSPDTPTADSST